LPAAQNPNLSTVRKAIPFHIDPRVIANTLNIINNERAHHLFISKNDPDGAKTTLFVNLFGKQHHGSRIFTSRKLNANGVKGVIHMTDPCPCGINARDIKKPTTARHV
jgi:hypothetical protein